VPRAEPEVRRAAEVLGIDRVEFLYVPFGEVSFQGEDKVKVSS
jgi:hypothetical protein